MIAAVARAIPPHIFARQVKGIAGAIGHGPPQRGLGFGIAFGVAGEFVRQMAFKRSVSGGVVRGVTQMIAQQAFLAGGPCRGFDNVEVKAQGRRRGGRMNSRRFFMSVGKWA